MSVSGRFTAQGALVATICWVAVLAATGSGGPLLFMAPALLIAIPLLGGRYIGEELIVRLATRRDRPPRRPAISLALPLSPPESWRPRGSSLLAFSFAKRPPPLRALPQS